MPVQREIPAGDALAPAVIASIPLTLSAHDSEIIAIESGRLRACVRRGWLDSLLPAIERWAVGEVLEGRALAGGRGGAVAIGEPGNSVVLRPYRRGGVIRHFNREHFVGLWPRPFSELEASEHLRALGIESPEALAAAVVWTFPGLYRGLFVTREVPHAKNLWEYMKGASPVEREAACVRAATLTRRMHDRGVRHTDLNLQNYLVTGPPLTLHIIDCDRLYFGRVSPRQRARAFERICRSIRKLDPMAEVLTLACVEALHEIARP